MRKLILEVSRQKAHQIIKAEKALHIPAIRKIEKMLGVVLWKKST